MIDFDLVVSYRGDLDTTDLDVDKVMMDLEKEQYFALNSVATRIWNELERPVKVGNIVETLLSEYDVERAECEKSVLEFVQGLEDAELICRG